MRIVCIVAHVFFPSGSNKSGSPGCVFGVVVTAGYEALPKGVVVIVKLLLCNYWVGWEIDSRNG
jgi:hypothetical protein